jgi:hypothetical protein
MPHRPGSSLKEPALDRPRFPFRLLSVSVMVIGVAGASVWYMKPAAGIDCNKLAPLTVLATVAAFLISICFRLMARHKEKSQRWFLFVFVLIAAATLFSDFRYVRRYRDVCDSVGSQMHPR